MFPAEAFIGRKARVEISGDATTWTSTATVSFGDGITVDQVTLASPTDLFADITIAPTAALGLKDVAVTDAGKTYTLTQAFSLVAPIKVTFQGVVAQGSIPTFTIVNKDFDNPFDDTSTGDGFFTPITYTNINITGPTGATFQISAVTPYKITGIALIDVDAAAGAVSVDSGPAGGDIVTSPLGANMMITARQPVALVSGTAATFNIQNPFDSALYSNAVTAPMLSNIFALADDMNASPSFVILGGSGHFATDFVAFVTPQTNSTTNSISLQSGNQYLIYWDNSGASGYGATLKATNTALTATAESAASETTNNLSTGAQALTLPAAFTGSHLKDVNDQDWTSFTVTAAMVGKHVHVTTVGDPQTDTLVDVYSQTAVAQPQGNLFDGTTADADYQEDIDSAAIPMTAIGQKIYVRISASQAGFFSTSHEQYDAAIFLD